MKTPQGVPEKPAIVQRAETTSLPPEVLPPEIANPTQLTSMSIESTLAVDVAPRPTASSAVVSQVTSQSTTTTASQSSATAEASSDGSNGGVSTAALAGIVIGVLAGILIVFVMVWLIVSSRKKKLERQRQQIEDDEKINGPFGDSAAIRTPTTAPRLSLRPVTQFLPNFNSTGHAERRASRGIALTLNPVSAPSPTASLSPLTRPTGGSAWERPTLDSTMNSPTTGGDRSETSNSLHPNNPFNDAQRIPDEPVSPISSLGSFDHHFAPAATSDSIPEPVSPIDGEDGFGVASGPALTRKTSVRKDLPKPLDLTKPPSPLFAVPPSPAGTEYSMHSMAPGQSPGPSASAAAIAAAGGPSQSTVHRVQLDFKPTLADELELRAGQLVRLLHEYDDGWALCIRLDRSQQGVVPRTCLSTRPVKPRPAQAGGGSLRGGPPVNPSYHHQHQHSGSNASSRYGRPHSPGGFPPVPYGSRAGRRPVSPTGGNGPRYHPQGRPHSPSGGTRQGRKSPGGQEQQRYPDYAYGSSPPMGGDSWGPAPGQAY
ncbi:Myosin-1 [Madurella mycetomatis]|uniref:Myosin-1 n=1 Tax=Madurella mycetomatis TaxID=100816 RepID=A0A175VZS0_9PEZI|nr:Myosin-1 [Madurella mycetomatis]